MKKNEMRKAMVDEIEKKVQTELGDGWVLASHEVMKVNGNSYTGLSAKRKELSGGPCLDLERFIKEVESGKSIDEVAKELANIFRQHGDDIKGFEITKDKVLKNVVCELCNTRRNVDSLDNLVKNKWLDLTVVYRVYPELSVKGCVASMLVTKQLCEEFHIDEKELIENAKENTIAGSDVPESLGTVLGIPEAEGPKMFVLTNKKKVRGASLITFPEMLRPLADALKDDLWILPSSIHECLVLPKKVGYAVELREMVREVNDKEVAPEDILSYNVYQYIRAEDKVSIA